MRPFPLLMIVSYYIQLLSHLELISLAIFVVVLFLLIGSPTAIQVASMCQLNDVFEEEIVQLTHAQVLLQTMVECLVILNPPE